MNRSAMSLTLELRIIDIMGTGRGKDDLSRENGFIAGLKEALELKCKIIFCIYNVLIFREHYVQHRRIL